MKQLLIAGCGDLGMRLAERLAGRDWQVTGLRRDVSALPASVTPLAADLSIPESLDGIQPDWDAVVYQATPGQRNEAAYRRIYVDGLARLLGAVDTRRLIYVSSTAVYGQNEGQWVDETSAAAATAFNGRILLDGERLALEAAAESIVVRFSGIYGPGREYLIHALRSGGARCRPEPPQWTNRIHAEDCSAVLDHLLELPAPDSVYCASDSLPAPRCEVLDWLSERLGVARPARIGSQDDGGQGKRVANRRLLASGFEFQFPDYMTGYGAILP